MDSTDKTTQVGNCIGTFDNSGFPITTSKNFSNYATVTFQAISLNMLVTRSIGLGPMKTTYIRHKNGSAIRIERNNHGFVAYWESPKAQIISIDTAKAEQLAAG
ncbi:MAG: hypothetical protein SFW36_05095 [Leptolyngbyaceae cyanobacterium bins.59]|nr:hypothetical protein [Leptolyngbyaceae cyanobacterium bins.59]